jgi:hypothetical protein
MKLLIIPTLFILISFNNLYCQNETNLFVNDSINIQQERNISIGYQVGGYTLVGIKYEFFINERFGMHWGVGIIGYCVGIDYHINNNSLFDFSFKDGGLGLINTIGINYTYRWRWNKSFGTHIQIGPEIIVNLEDDFAKELYGDKEKPKALIGIGLGFTW